MQNVKDENVMRLLKKLNLAMESASGESWRPISG